MKQFENRWRIQGTLTTVTPLHVGNGQTTERPGCSYLLAESGTKNGQGKRNVEIAAVATDVNARAYIPGTALKGNVRAWCKDHADEGWWKDVFGIQDLGGKAEFWDSHWTHGPADGFVPGRCWSLERLTSVAAFVNIDRRTRTASARKLFHAEFVPPGISFQVTVTGQDLCREEIELLLQCLEAFNDASHPIVLGGHTSDNWGRLKWQLESIREMGRDSVLAWLKSGAAGSGYNILGQFSVDHSAEFSLGQPSVAVAHLSVDVKLEFDGLFLVNDPSQARTGSDSLAHAPVSDQFGRPFLPASSFRGALRSQAEKILRTIGGPSAAWRPGEEGLLPGSETVVEVSQLPELCLASRVFGAPGWRTPIAVTDFTLAQGAEPHYITQEMLAIDRFTGGSPTGLKFNAHAICRPCLQGTLTLNLKALEKSGARSGGLLLLALTLRDLREGDISFGFGAGKGYGSCRARIEAVRWPKWESIPPVFREGLIEADLTGLLNGSAISPSLAERLAPWFEDLKNFAQRSGNGLS